MKIEISEYRGAPAATPDLRECDPVASYGRNEKGRDFVVGDIHGMFAHLSALLREIGFAGDRDRLFSVGDLVDRGPDSADALEWLKQPWFQACRGNHEQFCLDSSDPTQLDVWVRYNGGEWWTRLAPSDQEAFREAFACLPLAIEVETDSGTVGIVHADVPPLLSWDLFMDLLKARDRNAMFYAIWSRNRITGNCTTLPVSGGVERVYCGHTPTRETLVLDNVYYIDTGAVYCLEGYTEAQLTVVEIHPERHREYAVSTHRPVDRGAAGEFLSNHRAAG